MPKLVLYLDGKKHDHSTYEIPDTDKKTHLRLACEAMLRENSWEVNRAKNYEFFIEGVPSKLNKMRLEEIKENTRARIIHFHKLAIPVKQISLYTDTPMQTCYDIIKASKTA